MPSEPIANGALASDAALKGYWKIDETSGTNVDDASSAGHDGTASRTNILNNTAQDTQFGKCGLFVGASSDKITIANHADFNVSGNFSFSLWVKFTSTSEMQIFTKGAASAYSWGLVCYLGKITINLWQQGGGQFMTIESAAAYNDDLWHNVAISYDGTTLKLYVDNTLASSTTKTSTWYNGTAAVIIGGRADGSGYYSGYIDEVAFFNNKVLSATDVSNIVSGNWWTATTNYLTNYRPRKRTPGAVSV